MTSGQISILSEIFHAPPNIQIAPMTNVNFGALYQEYDSDSTYK